jgi:uncharacterized damage-inducible protein DinB
MDPQWFDKLYRHMEWADAMVWAEVLRTPALAEDDFIAASLLHLHHVQWAYLTGWEGHTPEGREMSDFDSLRDVMAWGREFHPRARQFLDGLQSADLEAKPEVLWPDLVERFLGQPPVRIPLGDMVFQVASHSVHHRAQVNRRIRDLGGRPPFIDYVAWAWKDQPAPDWP